MLIYICTYVFMYDYVCAYIYYICIQNIGQSYHGCFETGREAGLPTQSTRLSELKATNPIATRPSRRRALLNPEDPNLNPDLKASNSEIPNPKASILQAICPLQRVRLNPTLPYTPKLCTRRLSKRLT